MRAVAFHINGGPEVLRPVNLPDPAPGPGEVLVRVAYAGVNYAEAEHRRGVFGPADGEPDVPGLEVSGHVAGLGPDVSGLDIGQAVTAYLPRFGGYAELAVTPASFVLALPPEVDLPTAAGFPCVAPTAYGVLAAGRLSPGDTVLIHAAAGGVGTVAAQLATLLGATAVFGTVGDPGKADYAQRFGYDAVLPRVGFADAIQEITHGRGVDVVLDPVGGPVRADSLDLLAPFGRLVAFGNAAGQPDPSIDLAALWKNNRTAGGYNIGDLARRAPHLWREHATTALDLLARARIHLDITDVLPLADVARAHQRMDKGTNRGKTILAVDPPR